MNDLQVNGEMGDTGQVRGWKPGGVGGLRQGAQTLPAGDVQGGAQRRSLCPAPSIPGGPRSAEDQHVAYLSSFTLSQCAAL